ncbi:hypothetical protein CANCADRAFT_110938 [Tortispora caseinolytica NRRL Y-17796]|uniref:GP-PDE domain-containing protein n=1 Tax=Tortispora caseinolytica NRRL Y-17796 TaxID=767744 RepID=A0A1E4TG88_9ASCO|nr:hypothetical protein CANCADRAFT_110938 [Tortispora caseinolytica NRRL Y-17796]
MKTTSPSSSVWSQPRTLAGAHRGSPNGTIENSFLAISEALNSGAKLLEVDVHESKDHVVVLSHDRNCKRLFNYPMPIIDCYYYGELDKLRSVAYPHTPLATLYEVLDLLEEDEYKDVKIILDVKSTNGVGIFKAMADTFAEHKEERFLGRVMVGISNVNYLPYFDEHMPSFQLQHIGASVSYAKKFLDHPRLTSFSMLKYFYLSGQGRHFTQDCLKSSIKMYAWTVNDAPMVHFLCRNNVTGIISDNYVKTTNYIEDYYNGHCETWTFGQRIRLSVMSVVFSYVLVPVIQWYRAGGFRKV